ncbi:MAG: deoxyguanosinetriphosphate triphosphohydrolase [Desulfurellaceae bacterium]|nr:deoxyguanosinetriphosphate triphosphohydrolase [Desulfurellaceae bacterium]
MNIREKLEKEEENTLHKNAAFSCSTKGRKRKETLDDVRTEFMRDRDRIIHCKAFRRLQHKTQVFLSPTSDHYRTRLTHTLEVAQIARTISKALFLNETLTEAIALGHDLGHTPFGHAGETALNKISKNGFKHEIQSLRIADIIAKEGNGLNLTEEVRDGILKHSKGRGSIVTKDMPYTLEGQIVRISDCIAYVNHDIDDAIRAGIIENNDLPKPITNILGNSHSKRIATLVKSVIKATVDNNYHHIDMENEVLEALEDLRNFLFENVYFNEKVLSVAKKAEKIIEELFYYFLEHAEQVKKQFTKDRETVVIDYISGMTDRFALETYKDIFLPKPWGNK